MTAQEAMNEIRILTQAEAYPTLTPDELALLLGKAKRADVYGLAPSDASWTPTFNLNAAIAQGWEMKAGKVAAMHDTSLGGDSLRTSQIYEQCMKQAATYRRKISGSVSVSSSIDSVAEAAAIDALLP